MSDNAQELTPREKQEVEQHEEQMRPGRAYVPQVDISENQDAIYIRADMPGVGKDHVQVELHEDVLSISGQVSVDDYEGLQPLHTEYNVGNYVRRFTLPDASRFDRNGISAHIANGVLELRIPKSEQAKPRRIQVGGGNG
jgi:HSP20 family molecular chaperone IbpA